VKGRDLAGIVLGVLIPSIILPGVLILSIILLGFRYPQGIGHHFAYAPLLAGVLLFLSICVSIPTKCYEGGVSHAIGIVAFSTASAIAVFGVATILACLIGICFYRIEDEWWLVPMVAIAAGLALLSFLGSCAYVLAKKVQPRLAHLAVGTAVGFVLAGLCALLVYHSR